MDLLHRSDVAMGMLLVFHLSRLESIGIHAQNMKVCRTSSEANKHVPYNVHVIPSYTLSRCSVSGHSKCGWKCNDCIVVNIVTVDVVTNSLESERLSERNGESAFEKAKSTKNTLADKCVR